MGDDTNLGKKGETKLKEWLTHPEEGFFCYRLKDQLSGFYGSANMCISAKTGENLDKVYEMMQ